jgi:hypothetical protein
MWDLWRTTDIGTGFSLTSSVFPVNIIPPLLHTKLSPPHQVCDNADQAVHYHALGRKLGASSLTRHLAGLEEEIFYFIL